MDKKSKCVFLPDNFGIFDSGYWRELAPNTNIEFIGGRSRNSKSKHGDYMVQRLLIRAEKAGGIDNLFVSDRTVTPVWTTYAELKNQYENLNTSHSYAYEPVRGDANFLVQDMHRMLKAKIRKDAHQKAFLFDGSDLNFFSAGNWNDNKDETSDLGWPQAHWADLFANVFLIAACNDNGSPAWFSSRSAEEEDEGKISIAYQGVKRKVRDPETGQEMECSGTSPACAEACGDVTGRGIFRVAGVKRYWEEELTIKKSWYDEWARGEHHEANGRGAILEER